MPKVLRSTVIILIPLLHLYFAFKIVQADYLFFQKVIPLLLLLPLLLIGTYHISKKNSNLNFDFFEILLVICGAFSTYFLNTNMGLGPLISSGIIGLFGSFIVNFNMNSKQLKRFQFAIYCGAFVGMSSTYLFQSITELFCASLIAGCIFVAFTNYYNGLGGKHGAIAFAGVIISNFIFYVV